MPELPEVETVRRGLAEFLPGRTMTDLAVHHPRTVRRQPGGSQELLALTRGRTVRAVHRRGKYLWWSYADDADDVLVAHLGMSGQFRVHPQLVEPHGPLVEPVETHVRATWRLGDGRLLVFRDQRTFGWLVTSRTDDHGVPLVIAHVGRDPFEAGFDLPAVADRLASSHSGIKRLLLSQRLVSGVGNIYADEALWRARVHPDTPGARLRRAGCARVLQAATDVMAESLLVGGTSFDPLYVAVNGESGWFARSLDVYGRESEPCRRCGTPIVRERFTNRSSHRCPRCQPARRQRGPRARGIGH